MSLRYRQVHLDFHTSPHIPDVGADFVPAEFAATLAAAHVNSVTVFAKCHHGYSYYPTRIGVPHPGLKRDLLGEMIAAAHDAGIRAPVYTTLAWDELAWAEHPDWRQITPDGRLAGKVNTPLEPGWKNLCMNTAYGDYVIAQIEEVMDCYPVDGWFIDIVSYLGGPCICMTCLAQMQSEGVDPKDPEQLAAFALAAERRFISRCTAAIRAKKPEATVFYNARLRADWDPAIGNRPEMDDFTHLEIESLPGGFWGYDHFPLSVRFFQTFGKDLLSMTGRFHTWWGDFGGLRNHAALSLECFQALAHGAANSVGDQLHPRGRLDPTVYARIGEVYAEVARREPWCEDSVALPEIGVLLANRGLNTHEGEVNESDRGALHILEQGKYQFQYLDASCDLLPYALLILPDEAHLDADLAARVRSYLAGGGRLLLTGASGLDAATGDFHLAEEMGVLYLGPAPYTPDYLVLGPELGAAPGLASEPMNQVCEEPGVQVAALAGTHILARSGRPYFNRTWEHFCSHQYTPMAAVSDDPVIVENAQGNVIYCARPLFREYALSARLVHKQVLDAIIRRLLPRPRLGAHNLPSTAVVTVRAQRADLIVHLLHYVPQRRGKNLDVVEDVLPLHDVTLAVRSNRLPSAVNLVPQCRALEWTYADGYVRFTLQRIDGYQIVQIVRD